MSEEQLVVFRLGNEEYAIGISQSREIIQYSGATKIPNTPHFIDGIISLRGEIFPVIDLSLKFRMQSKSASDKKAIVIECQGKELGIIVDGVTEVIRLNDDSKEPAPSMANNNYVRGIGKYGDRLIILLDLDQLMNQEEFEMLKSAS